MTEESLVVVDESVLLTKDAVAANQIRISTRIVVIKLTPVILKGVVAPRIRRGLK